MRYKKTFWEQKASTHEEALETSIFGTCTGLYTNIKKVITLEVT